MILDLLFWLPIKLARHFLPSVTSMLDDLNNIVEGIADDTEAAIEEYAAEHEL